MSDEQRLAGLRDLFLRELSNRLSAVELQPDHEKQCFEPLPAVFRQHRDAESGHFARLIYLAAILARMTDPLLSPLVQVVQSGAILHPALVRMASEHLAAAIDEVIQATVQQARPRKLLHRTLPFEIAQGVLERLESTARQQNAVQAAARPAADP